MKVKTSHRAPASRDATPRRKFSRKSSDSAPTTSQDSGATCFILQGPNYDVRGVIDSTGALIERYTYTPYGQRRVFTSAGSNDPGLHARALMGQRVNVFDLPQPYALNPFGHQGLMHDEALGLIYNRAREYDPTFGRFMQRDPLGTALASADGADVAISTPHRATLSLNPAAPYTDGTNLYQYEKSNPLGGTDAIGTFFINKTTWTTGSKLQKFGPWHTSGVLAKDFEINTGADTDYGGGKNFHIAPTGGTWWFNGYLVHFEWTPRRNPVIHSLICQYEWEQRVQMPSQPGTFKLPGWAPDGFGGPGLLPGFNHYTDLPHPMTYPVPANMIDYPGFGAHHFWQGGDSRWSFVGDSRVVCVSGLLKGVTLAEVRWTVTFSPRFGLRSMFASIDAWTL